MAVDLLHGRKEREDLKKALTVVSDYPGLLISKYRVSPIHYRSIFPISTVLSPILLKRTIDKLSPILFGLKF